jgi:cytochrome c oxidase cbb3-type subunit III
MISGVRTSLAALVLVALAANCTGAGEADRPAAPEPREVPIGPLPGPVEANLQAVVNPLAGDGRALQEGRRSFVWYNCAGCHGDHGGGGMGPSLRDEVWLYGSSDAQIADSIVHGRNYGMPAWGRMLTSEQVWQITAYLKSMRTSEEPEPPR